MLGFDDVDRQYLTASSRDWQPPEGVDPEEMAERMRGQLRGHPLLQRYARAMVAGGGSFRCRLPWHAQGDRLLAAYTALEPSVGLGFANQEISEWHLRSALAVRVLLAHVYLWFNNIRDIAWAMPVPRHTIARDQMPFPMLFFSFESGLPVVGGEVKLLTDWWLLTHASDCIEITHNLAASNGEGTITGSRIPYGTVFPNDIPEERRKATEQVLSMLAFINSPFIDTNPQRLTRSVRRELERTGRQQDAFDATSVVTLRRKVTNLPVSTNEGQAGGVEWSSRWWVSGHIRAQWYPSLKAHKLIFIAPYIKGPEDKPFRSATYMVTR